MDDQAQAVIPRRGRRRAILFVLGSVGLILLSFAGIFASAWISAGKRIEQESQRVERELADLRRRRIFRPAYFEPSEEGNSWDHLAPAVASLNALDRKAFPYFGEKPVPSKEEVERIVMSATPAIEQLKSALRRTWVEPPHAFEKGMDMEVKAVEYFDAARIVGDIAEWNHRRGRVEQAVDLVIAGLGLADHLSAKGLPVHELGRVSIVKYLLGRFQSMLAETVLSERDLDRLDGTLAKLMLDRGDFLDALHRDFLSIDVTIIEAARQKGVFDSEGYASARHLYSARLLIAEFLQLKGELVKRLEASRHQSWKVRQERAEAAVTFVEESDNAVFKLVLPSSLKRFEEGPTERTCVDLARTAIALARYRRSEGRCPPKLSDLVPFYLPALPSDSYGGRPFNYLVKEDTVVLYAWGSDHDDDGGRSPDEWTEGDHGDWAWTLKRLP